MKVNKITPSLTRGGSALAPLSERSRFSGRPPALLLLLALILMLTGCAGMIFSHKPYSLRAGTVTDASPEQVVTVWPKERWFWGGDFFGNAYLIAGDSRTHVCSETVPKVGAKFERVNLTWEKSRKCWRWESQ